METAFGASDATGAWDWKTAYDACEAATVLFLRKFGPAIRAKATSPAAMLPMLAKIADFYEDEVDTAVAGLLTLLEPVMIAFLGVVVGGMIVALYLPIFNIATAVK